MNFADFANQYLNQKEGYQISRPNKNKYWQIGMTANRDANQLLGDDTHHTSKGSANSGYCGLYVFRKYFSGQRNI